MKNKISNLKTVKYLILLASLVLLSNCQNYQTGKTDKVISNNYADSRKVKIISVLQELSGIPYSDDKLIEENRAKIGKAIDKLENSEDLVTLALIVLVTI